MNRFMELKCTTTNWKICRMKKRRRTQGIAGSTRDLASRFQAGITRWPDAAELQLFELEVERAAEEFRFRNDVYPISQMRGVHAQIPTFLINVHKVDNEKDARAYIARLNAIPKLFD